MLKALALTLAVATLLASGFSLSPPPGLKVGETLEVQGLVSLPVEDWLLVTGQDSRPAKTDREIVPSS